MKPVSDSRRPLSLFRFTGFYDSVAMVTVVYWRPYKKASLPMFKNSDFSVIGRQYQKTAIVREVASQPSGPAGLDG